MPFGALARRALPLSPALPPQTGGSWPQNESSITHSPDPGQGANSPRHWNVVAAAVGELAVAVVLLAVLLLLRLRLLVEPAEKLAVGVPSSSKSSR